ncbi:hypothetical protein [Sporomusa sp. KB1]|nr:hypothetical protein [Sporomusa sp. KB1]
MQKVLQNYGVITTALFQSASLIIGIFGSALFLGEELTGGIFMRFSLL